MAEPNAPSSTTLVASNRSAVKRPSNGDTSTEKRQRITQQNYKKPVYDMNIVVMKHNGTCVAQVPLLNFQRFLPDRVKDLIEISEKNCWKFHHYDASELYDQPSVKKWVSWLEHWDLRAVARDGVEITNPFYDAKALEDTDYQDALVDNWLEWLQEGQCRGSLSVDRIRAQSYTATALMELHSCLDDLGRALILHHDAELGMAHEKNSPQYYNENTREAVRELAQKYFTKPGREPKDPLQLSADEFCQKYHSHHKKGLPCYKTKKLPEQTPPN